MKIKYIPESRDELKDLVNDLSINLGDIDTSLITKMDFLFAFTKRTDFSGIETWNTSNVTDMSGMFYKCSKFNQPIGDWNVANVLFMTEMFFRCKEFNQDI